MRKKSVYTERRETLYSDWLRRERGLSLKEAIAYATGGQAALDQLRVAERPQTVRERREARRADMSESDRRWERIQRPCPRKGCTLPVNHNGPHKVVRDLSASDALTDFARRIDEQ